VSPAVLPPALDLEGLRVEHREAAGAVAVGVAEHRDDDVVSGHAVHGVRPVYPVLATSSSGSITFSIRGARASSTTFTMWIREERKPGTIRCERSGPWQAVLHRFQP
jgi:hypothetical protein